MSYHPLTTGPSNEILNAFLINSGWENAVLASFSQGNRNPTMFLAA